MGHVYQCMTLSERLSEKAAGNAEIRFMTKSGDAVMNLLKKTGRAVSHHDNDDSIFNSLRDKQAEVVIIDKLDVAPELARKISIELRVKLAGTLFSPEQVSVGGLERLDRDLWQG
jgi:spore coat polysaccharide biosynthesis predicted glycosyltransferase SpsG